MAAEARVVAPPVEAERAAEEPADGRRRNRGDTPSGQVASGAADGTCDILEAVAAARAAATVGECANPSRCRRVLLTGGTAIRSGKTLRFARTAERPDIPSASPTDGRERPRFAAVTDWLLRPGRSDVGCLVARPGGATVAVSDVTLTQAPSLSLTGACVSRGDLGGAAGACHRLPPRRHVRDLPAQLGCDHETSFGEAPPPRRSTPSSTATRHRRRRRHLLAGLGRDGRRVHSAIVNNIGRWRRRRPLPRRRLEHEHHPGLDGQRQPGGRRRRRDGEVRLLEHLPERLQQHDREQHRQRDGRRHPVRASRLELRDRRTSRCTPASSPETTRCRRSRATSTPAGTPTIRKACRHLQLHRRLVHLRRARATRRHRRDRRPACSTRAIPGSGPLDADGRGGDLPVHPLLAGSPADRHRAGRPDVGRPARRVDHRSRSHPLAQDWSCSIASADGDGDGTAAPDLGAIEMNPRWQTELLTVAAKVPPRIAWSSRRPGVRPRRRNGVRGDERHERVRHLSAADRASRATTT